VYWAKDLHLFLQPCSDRNIHAVDLQTSSYPTINIFYGRAERNNERIKNRHMKMPFSGALSLPSVFVPLSIPERIRKRGG